MNYEKSTQPLIYFRVNVFNLTYLLFLKGNRFFRSFKNIDKIDLDIELFAAVLRALFLSLFLCIVTGLVFSVTHFLIRSFNNNLRKTL